MHPLKNKWGKARTLKIIITIQELNLAQSEAVRDETGQVMIQNEPESTYAKQFRRRYREKLELNQVVRIAKNRT